LEFSSFLVGLFLLEGASSFTLEWITGHFDFSFFPVNFGVVILELVIAKDQVLFSKSGDGQKHPFGVSLVPENHIYDLRNLSCFVGGPLTLKTGMLCERVQVFIPFEWTKSLSMKLLFVPQSRRALTE